MNDTDTSPVRWAGPLLVLLMAFGSSAWGCDSNKRGGTKPSTAAPASPDAGTTAQLTQDQPKPELDVPMVHIHAGAGLVKVSVEIAKTPAERAQGLMYRTELADGNGMVFLFDREQDHKFWMKNTLIPLDMVFIRSDFTIAGIVENATPKTLAHRGVGKPSKYVLEVPGGYSAKKGIKAGDKVEFVRVF